MITKYINVTSVLALWLVLTYAGGMFIGYIVFPLVNAPSTMFNLIGWSTLVVYVFLVFRACIWVGRKIDEYLFKGENEA